MQQLLSGISSSVNDSVNGRGVKHLKLTPQERIALAADVATGKRPFDPSLAQTCLLLDVPVTAVRAEIKARAANGNGPSEGVNRFVEAWAGLSQIDREQALQTIGIAEVWDVLANIVG
jgi:hypothetical protein